MRKGMDGGKRLTPAQGRCLDRFWRMSEEMRDRGRDVGKWHLEGWTEAGFVPPDRRFGFEHFVGFNRGHDYLSSIYFDDDGQAYHSERYEPDYQTDQFMEFIESAARAGDGKPFFGYVSYGPPHFPMDMPEYLRHVYRPDEVPLPPGVPNPELQRSFQQFRKEVYCGGDPRSLHHSHAAYDTKPPGEPETEAEIRQFIAEYYGMIHNSRLDLEGSATARQSSGPAMIRWFFLSDHGDMFGQHGFLCGISARPIALPCTFL